MEVRQLLRGDDRQDPGRGEVFAEVRALESESLLRARLASDGEWVAAVVPAPDGGRGAAPEGSDAARGDLLVRIWEGRHRIESGAYRIAAGLAARLPAGAASAEILEIGRAGEESREAPLPGRAVPAGRASMAGPRLTPAAVGRLSPWALRQVIDLGERLSSLACEVRQAALERLVRDLPDDASLLEKLLDQTLESGGEPAIVRTAIDLARARSFDQPSVLRALEVVAPLAPGRPEAKAAVAELLRRLPHASGTAAETGPDESVPQRPWKSMAPYCAARAALADRPREAVRWWRRAVDIDALRAAYRIRLAESLESTGDKDEAARQRRAARDLEEVPSCHQVKR
jgi:hypothetical protein